MRRPILFHPEATVELLLMYRVVEASIHQCRIIRFPYGIIYRLKEDQIEIIAIMHLHRRPGYWKMRVAGN